MSQAASSPPPPPTAIGWMADLWIAVTAGRPRHRLGRRREKGVPTRRRSATGRPSLRRSLRYPKVGSYALFASADLEQPETARALTLRVSRGITVRGTEQSCGERINVPCAASATTGLKIGKQRSTINLWYIRRRHNLKPSFAEETVKANEKYERSEVHVEDRNSGTMVNQSLSFPPIGVPENGVNLTSRMTGVEVDQKGISNRSVDEMASTSSCQYRAIVFNKNSADKDLFNLSLVIQSLCNLRHFRDRLLTEPLVWIPSVDNPCIAQISYEIFSSCIAGSPQTTMIKSFADLLVLLDEQFCKENNCEDCGNVQTVELSLSNTPHFFTIVLNWLGGIESQDTLSEVMDGLASPLETEFFCRSAHSATMHTVTSMICYDRYVCFARDNDKWIIYDFEAVVMQTEDTWEHLLERFKDGKLQPEVLFFEVIK